MSSAIAQTPDFDYLCGDITANKALIASITYIMSCQVFVKNGVTLTIAPGTTIYALPVGQGTAGAPALVIEQGGKINAAGTAALPITFTAMNPEYVSTSSTGCIIYVGARGARDRANMKT